MRISLKIPLAASLLAVLSCGTELEPDARDKNPSLDPPAPKTELVVISEAPLTLSLDPAPELLELENAPEAIGRTASGNIAFVAGGSAFVFEGAQRFERPLFVAEGDPDRLGAVHAVSPRLDAGAWVAADNGLFAIEELFVTSVPLRVGEGAVLDVSAHRGGPFAGLWLASEDGVFWQHGDKLEQISVDALDDEAEAVALNDGRVALIMDRELVILSVEQGEILSDQPPLVTGDLHDLVATQDAVFVASEKGLFRLTPEQASPWTQFTLAEAGEEPVEVLSLAGDRETGDVWARSEDALFKISGDEITRFLLEGMSASDKLAVDRLGDVWTTTQNMLAHAATGANDGVVTSFEDDVRPWIQASCSMCHSNQTQNFETYDVFVELAAEALTRVRGGDMPRCEGNLRCETPMAEDDYKVLEQWIRDGRIKE